MISASGLREAALTSEETRVLDAGTGTGVLVPFILAACGGAPVTIDAVDSSEGMLARAREKLKHSRGVRFIAADVTSDPGAFAGAAREVYDFVFLYSVLPHFHDRTAALSSLHAITKPGGRIVIMHSESREAINGTHGRTPEVADDLLPDSNELAKELEAAGFSVACRIETDRCYFIKALKAKEGK